MRILKDNPLTQFNELGLAEPLLRAVEAEGYTTPTPIQIKAIPPMLANRDVVGIAQTGTGKTAAFVLPVLHRILQLKGRPAARTCRTLVLAPTRELAQQIAEAVRVYGKFMPVSVAVVVGGASPGPQVKAMGRGLDVLVATPGRLLDHMGAGAIMLNQVDTVILDEADQMMDLGFMPAIRRILSKVPAKRQTLLLSATMPKAIRSLADDFLNDPVEVSVTPQAKPVDIIAQSVVLANAGDKRAILIDILNQPAVSRAIVFTRTKRGADRVSEYLDKAGIASAAIHGNKSQSQRERALGSFRTDKVKVLVATDIAARGIDVDGISHVINFELPNVPEAYVHRIGRTARAGASGTAITLCDSTEKSLLRDIERLIGRAIPSTGSTTGPDAPPPRQQRGRGPARHAEGRSDGGHRNGAGHGHGGGNGAGDSQRKRTHRKGPRPNHGDDAGRSRDGVGLFSPAKRTEANGNGNGQPQANGNGRSHANSNGTGGNGNGQRAEARPGTEKTNGGVTRMLGKAGSGPRRDGNRPLIRPTVPTEAA